MKQGRLGNLVKYGSIQGFPGEQLATREFSGIWICVEVSFVSEIHYLNWPKESKKVVYPPDLSTGKLAAFWVINFH